MSVANSGPSSTSGSPDGKQPPALHPGSGELSPGSGPPPAPSAPSPGGPQSAPAPQGQDTLAQCRGGLDPRLQEAAARLGVSVSPTPDSPIPSPKAADQRVFPPRSPAPSAATQPTPLQQQMMTPQVGQHQTARTPTHGSYSGTALTPRASLRGTPPFGVASNSTAAVSAQGAISPHIAALQRKALAQGQGHSPIPGSSPGIGAVPAFITQNAARLVWADELDKTARPDGAHAPGSVTPGKGQLLQPQAASPAHGLAQPPEGLQADQAAAAQQLQQQQQQALDPQQPQEQTQEQPQPEAQPEAQSGGGGLTFASFLQRKEKKRRQSRPAAAEAAQDAPAPAAAPAAGGADGGYAVHTYTHSQQDQLAAAVAAQQQQQQQLQLQQQQLQQQQLQHLGTPTNPGLGGTAAAPSAASEMQTLQQRQRQLLLFHQQQQGLLHRQQQQQTEMLHRQQQQEQQHQCELLQQAMQSPGGLSLFAPVMTNLQSQHAQQQRDLLLRQQKQQQQLQQVQQRQLEELQAKLVQFTGGGGGGACEQLPLPQRPPSPPAGPPPPAVPAMSAPGLQCAAVQPQMLAQSLALWPCQAAVPTMEFAAMVPAVSAAPAIMPQHNPPARPQAQPRQQVKRAAAPKAPQQQQQPKQPKKAEQPAQHGNQHHGEAEAVSHEELAARRRLINVIESYMLSPDVNPHGGSVAVVMAQREVQSVTMHEYELVVDKGFSKSFHNFLRAQQQFQVFHHKASDIAQRGIAHCNEHEGRLAFSDVSVEELVNRDAMTSAWRDERAKELVESVVDTVRSFGPDGVMARDLMKAVKQRPDYGRYASLLPSNHALRQLLKRFGDRFYLAYDRVRLLESVIEEDGKRRSSRGQGSQLGSEGAPTLLDASQHSHDGDAPQGFPSQQQSSSSFGKRGGSGCGDTQHRRPPAGYVCRVCKKPGHYVNDCPVPLKKKLDLQSPTVPAADAGGRGGSRGGGSSASSGSMPSVVTCSTQRSGTSMPRLVGAASGMAGEARYPSTSDRLLHRGAPRQRSGSDEPQVVSDRLAKKLHTRGGGAAQAATHQGRADAVGSPMSSGLSPDRMVSPMSPPAQRNEGYRSPDPTMQEAVTYTPAPVELPGPTQLYVPPAALGAAPCVTSPVSQPTQQQQGAVPMYDAHIQAQYQAPSMYPQQPCQVTQMQQTQHQAHHQVPQQHQLPPQQHQQPPPQAPPQLGQIQPQQPEYQPAVQSPREFQHTPYADDGEAQAYQLSPAQQPQARQAHDQQQQMYHHSPQYDQAVHT